MVDLRPDTSIYNRNQMSIGDLLSMARNAQQLQTDRGISRIIGESGGDTEEAKRRILEGAKSGDLPLVGPGDLSALSHAGTAQLDLDTAVAGKAAGYLHPLTVKPNLSPEDIAGAAPGLATIIGPSRAKQFTDLLKLPRAQLRQGLLGFTQGVLGAKATTVERPGVAGEPPEQVSPYSFEQEIAGAGGIPTGKEGPEFTRELQASGNYTQRVAPLINALSSARKLPANATGGLNEEFNTIKKTLGSLGMGKNIDWDKVTKYEELKKNLEQWTGQQAAQGHQSNDFLLQTQSGNPNMNQRLATIKDLTKVAFAQEAKREVIWQMFSHYRDPKTGRPLFNSQFDKFRTWADKQLDTRAFLLPMMSKDARFKLLSGMSDDERETFDYSWKLAKPLMKDRVPEGGWYVPGD